MVSQGGDYQHYGRFSGRNKELHVIGSLCYYGEFVVVGGGAFF